MKPFFSFQKLAQISGNCIKFPEERTKHLIAKSLMFSMQLMYTAYQKTRTVRTLNKMLSMRTLKRTLKSTQSIKTLQRNLLLTTLKGTLSMRAIQETLSLRTLKRTLSQSTLKRILSLRTLKGPNQTLTPPCRLQWTRQGSISSMGWGKFLFPSLAL